MPNLTHQRRIASLQSALAPLRGLLERESIVEIMLNADGRIWIEELGCGMSCTDIVMSAEDADRMIRLVAASSNTEINERNPSLAAKLPEWGARLQASVPPIVSRPVFALRKPAKIVFTLDDYVQRMIISPEIAFLLEVAVKARKNILIGGGTGSGKTTFANTLLQLVAETEDRVYIVEDNPELQCTAENMLQILVQPPFYSHQRAVKDALRFRPDRIIVGEVRDGAALDLLKAWNTGHPGGLATIHANSPTAMLDRLAQLTEEVVPRAPRELIAEAVDYCIHITRDKTHPAGRRVSGIVEVMGIDDRGRWELHPVLEETDETLALQVCEESKEFSEPVAV
jgi:P-type conjugative transfer ATPase TrbB